MCGHCGKTWRARSSQVCHNFVPHRKAKQRQSESIETMHKITIINAEYLTHQVWIRQRTMLDQNLMMGWR